MVIAMGDKGVKKWYGRLDSRLGVFCRISSRLGMGMGSGSIRVE